MFNLYDKNGKNNLVYIKNNNNKIKKEIDEMNSKELKNDISINKNKLLKENIDNSSILKGINKNIKIDENKKIIMLNNMNNINYEKEISDIISDERLIKKIKIKQKKNFRKTKKINLRIVYLKKKRKKIKSKNLRQQLIKVKKLINIKVKIFLLKN